MYAPLTKTNLLFQITTDSDSFAKVDIPISSWESLQFGHSITMRARFFGNSKELLFGKCPELRDVSLGSSPNGYTFLCLTDMDSSPEHRLSRLPREIEFYIKKNSGLSAIGNQQVSIWLEFTFYPVENTQSESYKKLLVN